MARECGLSELIELPMETPTQRQIVDSSYMYVHPVGSLVDAKEVEFLINNDGQKFLDLANSEVLTTFRVKKGKDVDLTATDKVSVINYIAATMFNTIDVWLGNVLITERTPNQAFRAMVEIITGYGRDAAESWLQNALFFKDTAGQMDNSNPSPTQGTDAVNEGLKRRFEYTKGSKRVVVRSRIHSDLFSQPKPLINMVPLRLKFQLNKNDYCLMSEKDDVPYNIVIEDMALRIRKVQLADDVYNSMVNKRVVYSIPRVVVKEFLVDKGGKSFNIPNFVSGVFPQKIVIGFLTNDAANGNLKKNPFNFQHFNLTEFSLIINGRVHDGVPLEFDYENDQFESGYWELFTATGKKYRDDGMLIERNDYKSGYALYAFHISPSACNTGEYKDPERRGNIDIACKFAKAIKEPLLAFAYLQFESSISINSTQQVFPDYTA